MSSSGGIGPDGRIYCKHMEEAAKRKSNTSKHPNREFYCCKRGSSDQTKCNFWSWADAKLPRLKDNTAHAPHSSAPTLRTPKEEGSRRSPIDMSPTHPLETPQSRRPLEDIKTGSKQREPDLSPTRLPRLSSSSKGRGPTSSPGPVNTVPQPPSPVPTELDSVDYEDETQPRKTFSFLGLDCSPEQIISTIQQEGQPSTPKKRRLTPAADGISFGDGLSLTPPQTTRRVAHADDPEPPAARVCRRKGKEREGAAPAQTQDQLGPFAQDCYSGEPQENSLPLFTLPGDGSSTSSVSPTTAENVLDYTDGMKTRVKALSEYMESFDITQAAKVLQTIERQKIQYECRDRSQKMRIEELVAERDKLVAEVSRLKKELERSEESKRPRM